MTTKKQRCRKPDVFPCKTRCVRRYHPQSKKEQHCRNVAEGTPSTYLEWVKQQGQRKKQINKDRKKAGLPFLKSDAAGYLINPDKNKKGKLPASYRELAKEARRRAKTAPTPELKSKLESVAQRFDKLEESARERGGDLALAPKPKQKIDEQKETQARIDAKYASPQPSDDDIANWLDESMKNWSNPTPFNIERLAAQKMLSHYHWENTPETRKIIAGVEDKNSFMDAYNKLSTMRESARSHYSDVLKRKTTPDDYEHWLEVAKNVESPGGKSANSPKSYQDAVSIINTPNTKAGARKNAQAFIDATHELAKSLWERHLNRTKGNYELAESMYKEIDLGKAEIENTLDTYVNKPLDIESGWMDAEWDMQDYVLRATGLMRSRREGSPSYSDPDFLRKVFGALGRENEVIRSHLAKSGIFANVKNVADLKRRFRKFATENHPDKGGDPAKFRSIVEQYESILQSMR